MRIKFTNNNEPSTQFVYVFVATEALKIIV